MPRFNWNDLAMFVALERHGTLSGAGASLGMSPSSAQRRLSALEDALGERLFQRSNRRLTLTPAGEALLPQARTLVYELDSWAREARSMSDQAEGVVRITFPGTLAALIAPCLEVLRDAHPKITPMLTADDAMVDVADETDIALRATYDPPPEAIARKVGTIRWGLYSRVPPDDSDEVARMHDEEMSRFWDLSGEFTSAEFEQYGVLGPRVESFDSLEGWVNVAAQPQRWAVYSGAHTPERAAAWRKRHHPDAEVAVEVNTVATMHHVLRRGGLVGLLPTYLGEVDTALRRWGAPIAEAETDLWLLVHMDRRGSKRIRATVDVLQSRLKLACDLVDEGTATAE